MKDVRDLARCGRLIRDLIVKTPFPAELEKQILENYKLIYVHASYQINMGAELLQSQTDLYNTGIDILLNEIEYANKINAIGIVLHMGKNVKNKYDPSIIYNNMVKFIIAM